MSVGHDDGKANVRSIVRPNIGQAHSSDAAAADL
jgi:hypothetical protein